MKERIIKLVSPELPQKHQTMAETPTFSLIVWNIIHTQATLNMKLTSLKLLIVFTLGKLSKLKSGETWETVQIGGEGGGWGGGHFQLGKFKLGWGWGLRKSKKSQVPEGTKD